MLIENALGARCLGVYQTFGRAAEHQRPEAGCGGQGEPSTGHLGTGLNSSAPTRVGCPHPEALHSVGQRDDVCVSCQPGMRLASVCWVTVPRRREREGSCGFLSSQSWRRRQRGPSCFYRGKHFDDDFVHTQFSGRLGRTGFSRPPACVTTTRTWRLVEAGEAPPLSGDRRML